MTCTDKDCSLNSWAKGLCNTHYRRLYRASTPGVREAEVARTKAWRAANKEKHAAQQSRAGQKNKEKRKAYLAQWKRDNWETYKHYLAARKKRVKQATPPWADLEAIEAFYRNCPQGYHVDHIEPINGKDRCGLHILPNLQYLPAQDNLRKSNKAA